MNTLKIFGIGDLHLSFISPVTPGRWEEVHLSKPMDIFGADWHRHYQKIYESWNRVVGNDDLVLVPGDISWAMTLPEASFDLAFLGKLSGKIVMVRGNHDYWWQSIARVREMLPNNVTAIQNDSFLWGDVAICGSRGWLCPGSGGFSAQDDVVYCRELQRVELSLKAAPDQAKRVVLMTHFMPTTESHEPSGFVNLMEEYGVEACVYGHLHDTAHIIRLPEEKWGKKFFLVSADFVDFTPKLLWKDV